MLKINKSLKKLDLSNNKIWLKGIEYIGNALTIN